LAERYVGIRLRKVELPTGTLLALLDGEVVARERFDPDHAFDEGVPLPAVRAPHERGACLAALAAVAPAPAF
jgi:hypothetical protein